MPAPIPAETLILVDVDGVLNVALHDGLNHAVAFNEKNLRTAWKYAEEKPLAQSLCSIASRRLGEKGEGATYAELVADPGDLSQVLVGRLARLIAAAGKAGRVVLSSTWRSPNLQHKRKYLEASISKHLGRPFVFHGCTPDCVEEDAEDRLRILGDYISAFCAQRAATAPKLRVLVLDDFNINPLSGLPCDGEPMANVEVAEQYLLSRAGDTSCVSVRLVHTYDSWETCNGLVVEIGCGLTMAHFSSAMNFLDCSYTGGKCESHAPGPHAGAARLVHSTSLSSFDLKSRKKVGHRHKLDGTVSLIGKTFTQWRREFSH